MQQSNNSNIITVPKLNQSMFNESYSFQNWSNDYTEFVKSNGTDPLMKMCRTAKGDLWGSKNAKGGLFPANAQNRAEGVVATSKAFCFLMAYISGDANLQRLLSRAILTHPETGILGLTADGRPTLRADRIFSSVEERAAYSATKKANAGAADNHDCIETKKTQPCQSPNCSKNTRYSWLVGDEYVHFCKYKDCSAQRDARRRALANGYAAPTASAVASAKKSSKSAPAAATQQEVDPQIALLLKALLAAQNKEAQQKVAENPFAHMDQEALVKTVADHYVHGRMAEAAPLVAELERRRA